MNSHSKWLLFFFVLALGVYGALQYWERGRGPEFETSLVRIDTAAVANIRVRRPVAKESFTLKRVEGRWIATQAHVNVKALAEPVATMLAALSRIESRYIAAQQRSAWEEYGVAEEAAVHLIVELADGRKEELIIGRVDDENDERQVVAFVRLAGQEVVYAVEGAPWLKVKTAFADYRPRHLLRLAADDRILFFREQFPDTLFTYRRGGGGWLVNEQPPADSQAVESYLATLRELDGAAAFADDFDELSAPDHWLRALVLHLDGRPAITINCYRDSTRTPPYVLHSSQQPELWVKSDTNGLYAVLFPPLDSLRARVPNK